MPAGLRVPSRGTLRRALTSFGLSTLAAMTSVSAAQTVAGQQYAGAGCTATMENRSALVDATGTFAIPNVPAAQGQYQVHVVCPQPDGTLLDAYSPYYTLTNAPGIALPLLPLGVPAFQPVTLSLVVSSGSLNAVGATAQLATLQVFADGGAVDASLNSEGTTYISSSNAVATVSQDGLVTATGPGSLTITANNNGLVATVQIASFASLDSDGDGMPDAWEIANGLNPYDPTDAALDPDGDGLTNLQEYQFGTNPHVADTDGDGLTDGQEVALGTNPLVADTDGDGLSDGQEVALGTNPLVADTDGDGIPDGVEVKIGTNPLVPDVTTTVTGYVTNGDGTPSVGTSTVVLTYFNALTDTTGAFTILHVPITLGNVIASAEAIISGKVYGGNSQSTVPVGNGVTNVGTISLGQAGGQVSGTVTTPDGKPDSGAQVLVTGGADTRSAVTNGTGLYSVSGLQVGPVSVAVIDPTTSLRGQAVGALSSGSLTLNVMLASFGTVSGIVTDTTGHAVGAGVSVSISGALNATTTTDGVGHYSFSFVPLGPIIVDATDATGDHGRTKGVVTATAQTINANVQYLGQGTISGVVSDGAGNPVAGASLSLNNLGLISQYLTATTNSVGQYSFTNVFIGTSNLSAFSTLTSTGGSATATILSNGQTVTANIMLSPTANISGIVYRSDGTTPVAGATITVNGTAVSTTTSATGAYTISTLPLATYTVVAADATSNDRGQATARLTTSGQTVPTNIIMAGLGTVNITVVDGGGNPSPNSSVSLNTGGPFNQALTGVTTTAGTVTFSQVLAASNIQLSAQNPTTGLAGSANTNLTAGQTQAVTIQLQSAGTVQGTVYQHDGQTPASGVTVSVQSGNLVLSSLTAANGTYNHSRCPFRRASDLCRGRSRQPACL